MLSIYGPLCYGPNALATAPFRCVLLRNSMLLRRDRNHIQLPPRSPSETPQEARQLPPRAIQEPPVELRSAVLPNTSIWSWARSPHGASGSPELRERWGGWVGRDGKGKRQNT